MTYLEQLFSLEGRLALVTGASRGLGKAIAHALLSANAKTILVASNPERLMAAAGAFRQQGLQASMFCCDLADRTQIAGLIRHVKEQHGRIDVLVNAAGITLSHPLSDYPDEAWEKTLKVNLEAPFWLARGLAELMKAKGSGSVINITSINAEVGFPDNPAYVAAKGALKQLTKSLAVDLGPYGIRVNNVGPGYFRTDMTRTSWNDPQRRLERSQRTLLGRWGEPEDLAGLIVLLASDASAYITGQDIYVDGGWLTKGL
jgi:gluconate 5-dehydrogenase